LAWFDMAKDRLLWTNVIKLPVPWTVWNDANRSATISFSRRKLIRGFCQYVINIYPVTCDVCTRTNQGFTQSNPITGLDRPWGFQQADALRFQDNWYMKAVRWLALRTGRL
jgi:hypothetical protein